MNGEMEIRDKRTKGFFQIDNHVLDGFLKVIGPTAWAVYCVLCRRAHPDQKRTSVVQIATLTGKTTRWVRSSIKKLEAHSLIRRKKTQSISVTEILDVEQLDFIEKLISRGEPGFPSESRPEGKPVSPRKGSQIPLAGEAKFPTSLRPKNSERRTDLRGGKSIYPPKSVGGSTSSKARLSPAERATIDYKAVRRQLDAIQGSGIGSNEDFEGQLRTALHRAGVTKSRWNEIMKEFGE